MRFTRACRLFLLTIYLCIILLIALKNGYDYDDIVDFTNENDRDFDDQISVFGGIPREEPVWNNGNEKRIILTWTGGEIGAQHLKGCPDYKCEITNDRGAYNRSHAVLLYTGVSDPPVYRLPDQFFVFFTQESPTHAYVNGPLNSNVFNLTLGYRRDADIPCPYGYVIKRKKPLKQFPIRRTEVITGKDRAVAWFVSNCGAPSRRDEYVSELKKHIDVDIYGSCGTMSCSKHQDCNGLLERRYKFYLAFENSLCKDYATEKFWEKLTLNIVVIVLKRSIVANQAPSDSFIAADDFDSPSSLAAYLKKLDKNPELYLQRFQWRLQYRPVFLNGINHDHLERPWCFCKLCKRLWESPIRSKTYPNLNQWWDKEAHCDTELVGKLVGKKLV